MTGAVLVAIYLVALALFLGLDIISKVPQTLYAVVIAGLGALAGVSVVGGLHLVAAARAELPASLGQVAVGVAATAGVAGAMAVGRLLGAFKKSKSVAP
jgi:NAD(P) transhydrogenase subunit alpha